MRSKYILKKYWWFLVLLIVAGFYLLSNLKSGTLKSREIDFSISKAEKITRIVITSSSETFTLELGEEGWVGNQEFPVRTDAADDLLFALMQLQTASPLPLSIADSLTAVVLDEGLHVQVFSGKRRIKDFRFHTTQCLDFETIGLLRGARSAYRLDLPNYSGDIVDIFSTDRAYWTTRQIGIPNVANINAVEVEIPLNPELSFRIDVDDQGKYRLFALFQGVTVPEFDSVRVHHYLQSLSKISYRSKVSDLSDQEAAAILMMEPDFIFNIYPKEGKRLLIRIFPIPVEEYLDEFGRPVNFDLNRLHLAIDHETDIYEVAYIDFHSVLKDIFHFNPKFQP